MKSARRRFVLWLAGLSVLAIAAAAILGRQRIAERWYVFRLGSEDPATTDHAATRLAAIGSTRAIVPLIRQIPREFAKGRTIILYPGRGGRSDEYWTDSAVLKALFELRAPAQDIERELKSDLEEYGDLKPAMQEGRRLHHSTDRPLETITVF